MTQFTPEKQASNKRLSVFVLVLALMIAAIVATLLLANEQKNLRTLANRFGFSFIFAIENPPLPKPRPTFFDGIYERSVALLHEPLNLNTEAAFLRTELTKNADLCDIVTDLKSGQQEGWHASPYDHRLFECSRELVKPQSANVKELSSFFYDVKGYEDGRVISARAKIITDDTNSAAEMRGYMTAMAERLISHTNWRDFEAALSHIRAFKPVQQRAFGASLQFSQEPSEKGRYNLIFSLYARSNAQKRTRSFFQTDRWLALSLISPVNRYGIADKSKEGLPQSFDPNCYSVDGVTKLAVCTLSLRD